MNDGQTRRINCIKLLVGVSDLEFNVEFYMGNYSRDAAGPLSPVETANECGTSACFLGHGPLCGVTPIDFDDYWPRYALLFVPRHKGYAWRFLFSHPWPNSKAQAVARMHRYLQNGSPDEWSRPTIPISDAIHRKSL